MWAPAAGAVGLTVGAGAVAVAVAVGREQTAGWERGKAEAGMRGAGVPS